VSSPLANEVSCLAVGEVLRQSVGRHRLCRRARCRLRRCVRCRVNQREALCTSVDEARVVSVGGRRIVSVGVGSDAFVSGALCTSVGVMLLSSTGEASVR
jgi:hypothetical protein